MGRWTQLSLLGTSPGLGSTPTPGPCEASSVGMPGWSPGCTWWSVPWVSPVRDRGEAPGVPWGQATDALLSSGPQILFDQAQRSVRQQLHNFIKE